MDTQDLNTEQIILDAAEAEFLEKGYGNAKVIAIAKRAGVSHSMLHYYFRSKEKLFQVVFQSKVQAVSDLFQDIFNRNLPFEITLRKFIETQFDFMAKNPRLPDFMLNEILSNKENRALLIEMLAAKAGTLSAQLGKRIDDEVAKGNIRKMGFEELLINIIAINAFTFLAMPVLADVFSVAPEQVDSILAYRRESNVQFVLNSLRP